MSESTESPAATAQARNGLVLDDPGVVVEVTRGYFDVFAVGSEAVGAAGSLPRSVYGLAAM